MTPYKNKIILGISFILFLLILINTAIPQFGDNYYFIAALIPALVYLAITICFSISNQKSERIGRMFIVAITIITIIMTIETILWTYSIFDTLLVYNGDIAFILLNFCLFFISKN